MDVVFTSSFLLNMMFVKSTYAFFKGRLVY